MQIRVLSNRADVISSGDALVEIVPGTAEPQAIRVDADGVDLTNAFAVRGDGRFYGLVSGLREGTTLLTAQVPNGPGGRIAITNHPKGGPVFSGEQVQPWACNTTSSPSLGAPLDAQCNAPTAYRFMYRNTAGQFASYDPANPPPASSIAATTTDHGVTVPYIIRIERGTMNRGIHEIAVLFDPAKEWRPWDRQPQWNQKLLVLYGAGTSQQYRQGTPESVLNHEALSRGFAVVSSSMFINGQRSNFVTAAETTMMLKEHIIETYGEIRYSIAQGSSGGALLQYLIADSYPGLLNGLRPTQDWEDSISGAYREFADSGALVQAFNSSSMAYTTLERTAIGGWGPGNENVFNIENGRLPDYNRPDDGTNCAGAASYHPTTNPLGVRCTFQDFMVSILGRRPQDAYANLVYDNVGVQYGLQALHSGEISAAKFVDVNARAGGFEVNGRWQAQRSAIEPHVAQILHRTGQVTFGRELGKTAIIAIRGTNNNDYHYPFRTYVNRNRMIAANGHADNHVFWTSPPPTLSTLVEIDRWLAAVEADQSAGPLEEKIVRNKPADVATACWVGASMIVDQSVCDAIYPYYREPRTVAGDSPTIYTMKCQLKPLTRSDYPVSFTDAQWATLQSTFPEGVCDFSKPGVGFEPTVAWLTYAAGPGGRPLGEPPVSEAFGHLPDLAASSLSVSQQRIRGGDQVTFSALVSNLERADAANVAVRFLVDGVPLGSDRMIASLPGGSQTMVSSALWSAKHEQGSHTVQVVVDAADVIRELYETNNTASATFVVEGNKIRNGSFEQASQGTSPDAWTSSGATSYENGGADGERSVSAQSGGSWTSEPVAVTPGTAYIASLQTTGMGGTIVIQQFGVSGVLLAVESLPLPVSDAFQSAGFAVTALAGAASMRVVLMAAALGKTTFDNVQLLGN
jgi:hypothetical protein